uniref:NADH-ubiquinone oxidoreductase chain 5 n=1 Tax=Abraeinae sp. MJTNT-2012 TaxID=1227474 RepID=S4SV13_9COLE|nr:NADH dehydrogenase subunit 5 [Abraeinae sp. MJTNT-2012]
MVFSICKKFSVGLVGSSFFFFFIDFMFNDQILIFEYELFSLQSSLICMTVLLDWMSLLFMSFVLFISSMVIYYSDEYMEGDLNLERFIMLVVMFVFSMMFLIISPNLISILLGWDGLGLVSYCLVIYYQNVKSANAGMLTALSNRIGDVALLLSIAWMLNYGSWNYVFYIDLMSKDFEMKIISLLIILAAFTKSAQIPFSSWLPAAMAAPTPVSSLVHSSTLVTAGVYLLIRFNMAFSFEMKMFMLLISSLTMFMSGLGANFEFDLKKIIALSTLSQLGLMMGVLFLGEYSLAFFHLLTHALFKALLFMCAGLIIHNSMNCQDIRYMGGMFKFMPLTCTMFTISNFSLCGLPFLSGFYSKDLMLEVLSMNYLNIFIYLIFYFSTGLTVCYSMRLSYYTLFGNYNFVSLNSLFELNYKMLFGMMGLIFMVIFSGSMLLWLIFPSPVFVCLPLGLKLMTLFVIFMGSWFGYECSKCSLSYSLFSKDYILLSLFFSSMWNMPFISTFGLNYFFLNFGNLFYKNLDQGWSEIFGSQNIYNSLKIKSSFMQILFDNNIKIYLMMFVLWIVLLYFLVV